MNTDKRKRNVIHGKGQNIKDLFVVDMQREKKFFFSKMEC